jgi:hypothetical protein
MSNDPKRFIFKSLSRNISSWNEKGWSDCLRQWAGLPGRTQRTVRRCGADCPRGSKEPGGVLEVLDEIADRLRRGAGLSARLADYPREPCAGGTGLRADKSSSPFLLKPDPSIIHLSFSCSLSRKGPLLGDFVWGTPQTVRAHPQTLCEVLHHVIRVFFRITHSLSLSRILSKKVIRVWWCDLKIIHGFKFLAW